MSVNILIKRSDVASKRPDPNALFDGELALNFDAATGGLYYKDSNDEIVKIGPAKFLLPPQTRLLLVLLATVSESSGLTRLLMVFSSGMAPLGLT